VKRTIFVTGTDTGAGKTVLTALLVQFLRERGVKAAALKPICSGGRADARALRAAMDGALSLDEINPWHFRAPVAPLLAARREQKRVHLSEVLARIRAMQKRFDVLLIEGAGGLLSPLGENFNSRDLIVALGATPIIAAQNKLGSVNHVLLTLAALPPGAAANARVVLMSPPNRDAAAASNPKLLAGFFDAKRIITLPWLGENFSAGEVLKNPRVRRTLRALMMA
jgi:dethiobiotin synthetase